MATANPAGERESFRCTFDSENSGIDRLDEDKAVVYFIGEATGTHIGEGTIEHHHMTITDGYRRFVNGVYKITAENGDLLRGTYQGDTKDSTPPSRKGATGEWEHTGGTGKFDGVSGSGQLIGVGDLTESTIKMDFVGTVSI